MTRNLITKLDMYNKNIKVCRYCFKKDETIDRDILINLLIVEEVSYEGQTPHLLAKYINDNTRESTIIVDVFIKRKGNIFIIKDIYNEREFEIQIEN